MTEETEGQTTETEKVAREKQNGVTKPKAGTKTGRVWEIADAISAETGAPALRGPVMEKARAEGINDGTSATQYGKWCTFYNVSKADRQAVRKAGETDEGGEAEATAA